MTLPVQPPRAPVPKLGCGYAICEVLAVIGGAILFAAEAKWRQGEKTDAWIAGGIGGVFCLAAVGLIAPMKRAVVRAMERRRREDERPDEPWTWEPKWQERNGIPQSRRRNGGGMLFIGLIALLVSLPPLFAMPRELGRGNHGILVALVFPAIGIGILSVVAMDA